jgi:starch synthase/alpha-amylase
LNTIPSAQTAKESMAPSQSTRPRLLLVTPEVAFIPDPMTTAARRIKAGTGKQAHKTAALVETLFARGVDIHVALPNYRHLFGGDRRARSRARSSPSAPAGEERLHLAQDRYFFYQGLDASGHVAMDCDMSLAFQREVINHIIPIVQPDLIHCMDWVTGLIPAASRERRIPCLFSIHRFETGRACLNAIEDLGIDAAGFWQHLYYDAYPMAYEATREKLPVDFLASGLLASRYIWMDRPDLLQEIIDGRFDEISDSLKLELINKWEAGCFVAYQQATIEGYLKLYARMLGRPLGDDHAHKNNAARRQPTVSLSRRFGNHDLQGRRAMAPAPSREDHRQPVAS